MAYDELIDSQLPLHVLPLYSLLSSAKQAKVGISFHVFAFLVHCYVYSFLLSFN